MPAGSRMDLPLAKAEPIGNNSNASVIANLRRKKVIAQMQIATREERSDNMRTTLQTASFLIGSALEHMSAYASMEFNLWFEVKCSCLSASLNCISERADPRPIQANRKVST
ncbi:hypothetical protein BTVI_150418 [Pitangus sulphuratus]|nr:hypothetical protein BTVI_150418 [Pitangus sulphuratus]